MDTKICTKCKKDLPLGDYRVQNKLTGRLQSRCKTCNNEDVRAVYQKSEKRRQQQKKGQYDKIAYYKAVTNRYKEIKGCHECKIKYPYYVLEFHHLDSEEKEGQISVLIKSAGRARIKAEIEKCIVVCSNCHKKIHYASGNWNPVAGILE